MYLRAIPFHPTRSNRVRSRRRFWLALIILVTVAASCTGDGNRRAGRPSDSNSPSTAVQGNPSSPSGRGGGADQRSAASTLAATLTTRPPLADAVHTVEEVLANAGVATRDNDQVRRAAIVPAAPQYVSRTEVLHLALDDRTSGSRGRFSLVDVAAMLGDFGWPFGDDSPAVTQLDEMIREMVRWSQNNSDLSESFAGRYLLERVRRRDPNVDLAADARPSEIHFDSLDILVLTAFFDRGVTPSPSDPSGPTGKPAALDPCSQFRSSLGIAIGDLSHATANEVRRRLVDLATKKAGAQGAPGSFGDAIQALRVLDRLVRLFTLYSTASITIDVLSDNPIHKPTGELFAAFKARVGVSEEEWQIYVADRDQETVRAETALSDCLDQLGLPSPPGLGRIAAALSGWRVEWRAVQGMPEHAVIEAENSDFDLKGQYQHDVKRISEYTGETKPLIVRIKPERREDHEGNAPELSTLVTVRADLETSARPSLQTLIGAAEGA